VRSEKGGLGLKQTGNARRHRIELDARHMRLVANTCRHECRKQSGADAGLEHPAPAPAEALQARPHRADDELRREMGILGATRQRSVFGSGDSLFENSADLGPAGAKPVFARTTEHGIGELGSAEAGEADEPGLFFWRGRAMFGLDVGGEPDRSQVVAGALLPTLGQAAVAFEKEILASRNRLARAIGLRTGRRLGLRWHRRGDRRAGRIVRSVIGTEVAA
jgi:hypothetical protein